MGKLYDRIDGRPRALIEEQPLFFVATAPLAGDGHVNISPKGRAGTFAVLDEQTRRLPRLRRQPDQRVQPP